MNYDIILVFLKRKKKINCDVAKHTFMVSSREDMVFSGLEPEVGEPLMTNA